MPRFNKLALEHTAAGDLWKHTLSQIPTMYGRLSYLASLRDANSGIYRHHGLAAMFGRDESNRALRESHEQIFLEWIALSLREKEGDLSQHLAGLEEPLKVVVEHLWSSRAYRAVVPVSARRMERKLFQTDMETLLETIKNALPEDSPSLTSARPG